MRGRGFIAVCPQGTQIALPGDHRVWNSGPEYERSSGGADDVLFTRRLIDEVSSAYPIDPRRIYVTGFSNGGQMAYRLALELSDQIAAIAPMSGGRLAGGGPPTRAVPVLHFHAMADSVYPFEGGLGVHSLGRVPHAPIEQVIAEWVGFYQARAAAQLQSHDGWELRLHDGPAPVELVLVSGMGHQIAGGRDDQLPGQAMRSEPDSVRMALKFFTDHPI
jgi:polyhydroxybutyrate depolymerase